MYLSCAIHTANVSDFTDFTAPDPTTHSLNIIWNHPYKLCKSFTVLVDGEHVTDLDTGTTSHNIDGLYWSTIYNVTVVAKEPGMPDVSVSSNFITSKYDMCKEPH